jgi:hypothetical protein
LPGIYDTETGLWVAHQNMISVATLPDWLPYNGAHGMINDEYFGGSDKTVAFTTVVMEDRILMLKWRSQSVNGNNWGESIYAPHRFRGEIVSAVSKGTGSFAASFRGHP